MPNLHIKHRLRQILILLLLGSMCSFYVFHGFSMWQKASTYSKDGSAALGAFAEASHFLSQHLKQDEMALVPMLDVFYSLNPSLADKLVSYRSLWSASGVSLKADTTEAEAARVRTYLINFLKENPQVRYAVRDWNDPSAKRLFEADVNDELMALLSEVESSSFTLSTKWSNEVVIYENLQYAPVFATKLSSPPKWYGVAPSDTPVHFDSSGITIHKAFNSTTTLYLPLEASVDTVWQNYMTIEIKLDVEGLNLVMSFYYDKNGDGKFSGYDVDYIKQISFNQTRLGWMKGQWYKVYPSIPKTNDTMVQVAISARGQDAGTVSFANLIIYSQIDAKIAFIDASNWLSENVGDNDICIVSSPGSLFLTNPSLKGKLISFRSLWDAAGVSLGLGITEEEVLQVQKYFANFLKENPQVRYAVRDWVDPYAERLFSATSMSELPILLSEYRVMTLTIRTGWTRILTFYEHVQFGSLFTMNLTSRPERYGTSPSDLQLQFNSDGTVIQKAGLSVALYLPLNPPGISTSRRNYVAIQIKPDVEDLRLIIALYYDKNGDGKWSGYDIDSANSWAFNSTRLGWVSGKWCGIYQDFSESDYPIVQIGIVATGDKDGTLTLANLELFGEVASPS